MNNVLPMGLGARRGSLGLGGCELLLLTVALVWGSSYGVAKGALLYVPVLGFLALRFVLTALILLPLYRGWRWPQWRAALAAGLPMGGLLWLVFLAETYGVTQTSASQAAFLISLCVVLTPFVEWVLQGQRPPRRVWAAAGFSCAGTWLLVGGQGWVWSWGDALMLLAALLRAVLMAASPRLMAAYTGPSLALTAIQAAVVGLGSLVLALVVLPGSPWAVAVAPAFWAAVGYLVLGCTVFAFFAQNYAARRTAPSRVALLMGSEPLFGALFGVLWLGESLSPLGWLGAGLVLGATLWVSLMASGQAPARPPKPGSRAQQPPEAA